MTTFKDYAISSGHGKYVRGAKGYIDEVDEARKVVSKVVDLLQERGCKVKEIHDNSSKTQAQNVIGKNSYLVRTHNAQNRQIDISVHFNANRTTSSPMGTEVYYYSNDMKKVASDLSSAIAKAGGFKNRGGKCEKDLSFLANTAKPAILIEVCFVDSKADAELYKKNFNKICEAIAKTLSGKSAPKKETPKPVTPAKSGSYKVGSFQKQVQITTELNVRSGRGSEFKVLGAFKKNAKTSVWYIDKSKDGALWGSVTFNGKTGYVNMAYTKQV